MFLLIMILIKFFNKRFFMIFMIYIKLIMNSKLISINNPKSDHNEPNKYLYHNIYSKNYYKDLYKDYYKDYSKEYKNSIKQIKTKHSDVDELINPINKQNNLDKQIRLNGHNRQNRSSKLNNKQNVLTYNKNDLPINYDSTIIILDWDDTLYPTSWTVENGIDLTDPKSRYKFMNYFNLLDKYLSQTLKEFKKYGHVLIITNAMPEWVELSSSVLPKTIRSLKNIEIISARQKFQNHAKMSDWKKLTFKEELTKRIKKYKYTNVISIGDAEYEHNALINLYNWELLPHKYLKSIQFIKSSDYRTLIDQIKMIKKCISQIVITKRQMDLKFDIE